MPAWQAMHWQAAVPGEQAKLDVHLELLCVMAAMLTASLLK